jgi:hypothetical protein
LFCFKFDYWHSFSAFAAHFKQILTAKNANVVDLPTRMRDCLEKFEHSVLLILSGNDLTATEFKEMVKSDVKWQTLLNDSRVSRYEIVEADHTFSSSEWRMQVENLTINWLKNIKETV